MTFLNLKLYDFFETLLHKASPSITSGDIKEFSARMASYVYCFQLPVSGLRYDSVRVSVYVARIYSKTECRGLEEGGKCDLTLP